MKTEKVKFCTELLYQLGREEKLSLLHRSNLNDKEVEVIQMRYISGLTVAESAERFFMSVKGFEHLQRRTLDKLYDWIKGTKKGKEGNVEVPS